MKMVNAFESKIANISATLIGVPVVGYLVFKSILIQDELSTKLFNNTFLLDDILMKGIVTLLVTFHLFKGKSSLPARIVIFTFFMFMMYGTDFVFYRMRG